MQFFMLTSIPALPGNVALAIVLFGIAYTVFSISMQRKLAKPARMREIQAKIKSITKEMQEMGKRKEDVTAKQKELMPLMGESMKMQMKPMFVIFPIFLIVYYVLIPHAFAQFGAEDVQFIVPLNYSGLFFATVLISGLIASGAMLVRDRRMSNALAKKQQAEAQKPETEITAK